MTDIPGMIPAPDKLETSPGPMSVFKVYNSSMKDKESLVFLKGPDVFSWAAHQRITHDHGYCRPEHMEPHTPIDHGTVLMKNIHWYESATGGPSSQTCQSC